eukprot:5159395-Prymnesium_polylepis.1
MARPEETRTWAPTWVRIKELVFEASINETRRKNRKRNAELADKKSQAQRAEGTHRQRDRDAPADAGIH